MIEWKNDTYATILCLSQALIATPALSTDDCNPDKFNTVVTIARVESDERDTTKYTVEWPAEQSNAIKTNDLPVFNGYFSVLRCLPGNNFRVVGEGKIISRLGKNILAQVNNEQLYRNNLPDKQTVKSGTLYLRPMPGDIIKPHIMKISSIPQISENFIFANNILFEQDGEGNSSQDLSENGKQLLTSAITKLDFSKHRIAIESFINRIGISKEIQGESLFRASLVSDFFAKEFNVPREKLLPIGMGNLELPENRSSSPDALNGNNEGIRLRLIPY